MKKRLSAVAAACLILAAQSVSAAADWGYDDYNYDYNYNYNYDYNYGYDDNTWTDGTQNGTENDTDSSSTESQVDIANNVPVNVLLDQSKITDKKFTIDMRLDTKNKVTEIDMTILYDSNVLKMTDAKVNKKAAGKEGKGVAAETEKGSIQYQFIDPEGTEYKESFLTLSFEVIDPLEKASAVYMKVNSILDEYSNALSYRADGTIVQIAGAVEYDAKDDESMYYELRVYKSDKPISLEAMGFQNIASVQFEDKTLATSDNKSITTLAAGLTNMTVEFTDGTKKYYRLVVAESAAPAVTAATGTVAADSADGTVPDKNAADAAVQPQAKSTDPGLTKQETRSSSKTKYLIIYILVLVALIAVLVEFFVFYGNPYAKTAAILKQHKDVPDDYGSEGFNGSPLSIPNRDPARNDIPDEDQPDEKDTSEDDEYKGFDDLEDETAENADGDEAETLVDDSDDDGYEYDDKGIDDDDYYDAYDGYENSDEPRPADISTVEGYEGGSDLDGGFNDSSEEGVVSIEDDDDKNDNFR